MITESGFTYVVRYEEATYGAHFGSLDLILHFCGQMPFGIIIKDNFKISHPFGMNPLHMVPIQGHFATALHTPTDPQGGAGAGNRFKSCSGH